MATYREIKVLTVPYLDADPPSAVADTQVGSVWYNSSTGKLRAFLSYNTWATGGTANTGRGELGGTGPQTAAFICGGRSPTVRAHTEHYNGNGWSEVADLNSARHALAALGTQTASLAYGGAFPGSTDSDISEEFDGSSWSEGDDLNTARQDLGGTGAGTQTAGLMAAGNVKAGGTTTKQLCESYDGSSWTEVGELGTERY